jgi:hypothetical protein
VSEPTTATRENTSALYGFFCGVISLPTAFLGVGVLFGGAAIMLGRLGLQRANAGQGRRGMALTGMALGAVSVLLVLAYLVDQTRG